VNLVSVMVSSKCLAILWLSSTVPTAGPISAFLRNGRVSLAGAGCRVCAHHADHGRDVAVGQRTQNLQSIAGLTDDGAALQQHAQTVDQRRRQLAEDANGPLTDALALTIALAQEHGRGGSAIRDDVDEHGRIESHPTASMQAPCMDTFRPSEISSTSSTT
jgi:hypothetical protein